MKNLNREAWLLLAADVIRNGAPDGMVIPPVNVSCSWPGGGSPAKRIGECWPKKASKAGLNEVFISPKLEDPIKVLGVLCHELAHAVLDCEHGHCAGFVKVAKALGCEGKPTSMVPPEAVVQPWLDRMLKKHGPYPHRVLDKAASGQKKQKSRQLKAECNECAAVWRMSATQMLNVTQCPCCGGNHLTLDGQQVEHDELDGE